MKTFSITTITFATTAVIAATMMMTQSAQAGNGYQTRIRVVQPYVSPVPMPTARPALGIMGQKYHRGGIRGVRVVRDTMHRPLQLRLPCGRFQTAYFRTGYDIITNVNGRRVDCSHDIVNALNFGHNTLSVYDSLTGRWSNVQVHIHRPAPVYPMPVVPQPAYPAIAPAVLQP